MHVLTYASRWQPSLEVFLRSCAAAGLRPEVLGYGQTWHGFGGRLRRVTAGLAGLRGPVLFLDAFDMLVLGRAEELQARFLDLGHPLVFAAETNCYPDPARAVAYPACKTRYRYLNAGAWIGDAEYARALLLDAGADRVPDDTNDQGWLTELFLARPGALALDTRCELFQCLFEAVPDLEAPRSDAGRWRNRLTETQPLVFHGNGCTPMDFLL
jgi:hypothetical protein